MIKQLGEKVKGKVQVTKIGSMEEYIEEMKAKYIEDRGQKYTVIMEEYEHIIGDYQSKEVWSLNRIKGREKQIEGLIKKIGYEIKTLEENAINVYKYYTNREGKNEITEGLKTRLKLELSGIGAIGISGIGTIALNGVDGLIVGGIPLILSGVLSTISVIKYKGGKLSGWNLLYATGLNDMEKEEQERKLKWYKGKKDKLVIYKQVLARDYERRVESVELEIMGDNRKLEMEQKIDINKQN